MKIARIVITFFILSLCIFLPVTAQNQEKPQFYKYTVNSAEGFYSICKKFDVTQEEIIQYNPEARNGLKSGQELLIPIKGMNNTDGVQQNHIFKHKDQTFNHTIAPGETLYSISKMYNVSTQDIIKLNPESNKGIKAGAVLRIPQSSGITTSDKNDAYIYHTISPKETLFSLARQYSTSVENILKSNPGLSPANFSIGKVIRLIPGAQPTETIITKEKQTTEYQIYKVKKKETLYSIAQKFKVKVSDIVEINPGIGKISQGDELKIPVAEKKLSKEEIAIEETNVINQIYSKLNNSSQKGEINVALLLPFMLNEENTSTKSALFLEYYQGFLLAVDSLKQQGANINIYTYDTQNSPYIVNKILSTPELKNIDMIIGPVNDSSLKNAAEFAQKNNINLVNSFSLKNEDINHNPWVFQTNIPHSYLYAETINEFINRFGRKKIVFVYTDNDDKTEFTNMLKDELKRQSISYSEIPATIDLEKEIGKHYSETDDIVVVPSCGSRSTLGKVIVPLNKARENHPDMRITLFGYPEWQTYTKDYLDSYYHLNTYIFTRFYALPTDNNVKSLNRAFHYWYNKEMINANPKYGLLGFDTGMYFLTALYRYGKNFGNSLQDIQSQSLQTDFNFQRLNNWSGFINKNLYFVRFTSAYTIEKITIK